MIGLFRFVSCISVFQGLLLLNLRVGVNADHLTLEGGGGGGAGG